LVFSSEAATQETLSLYHQAGNMSATHFSLLSYDVLLYLVKFVEPVDCVNLLLSGILEGFENVIKGIDLKKRYKPISFDSLFVVFDST
jgi:hypothetical protein